MKLAIFSDTHRNTSGMISAVRRVSPDALVHLGDYFREAETLSAEFPLLPLYCVPGNCDLLSDSPDTISFMAGPVKVFATHGHRYSVKSSIESLLSAAYISGASLVLYGHTHIAHFEQIAAMTILNPGTAGKGAVQTFAVAEITVEGKVSCQIMNV